MAKTRLNKIRHCAVGLRTFFRLKCKNKFTIKKVFFFNQSWTFPPKVFRSRFDPKHGYKAVNKSSQKQSTPRSAHFGRQWLDGTDLVGCVLSLAAAAVTRLRLPDLGTLFRIPMGSEAFLEPPAVSGLRHCA